VFDGVVEFLLGEADLVQLVVVAVAVLLLVIFYAFDAVLGRLALFDLSVSQSLRRCIRIRVSICIHILMLHVAQILSPRIDKGNSIFLTPTLLETRLD